MHKNSAFLFLFCFIFILLFSTGFSQTKSNLEIFYSMVDSSGAKLLNTIPSNQKRLSLEFNSGTDYLALENRLIEYLSKNGIQTTAGNKGNDVTVRYIIDKIRLNYGEMYRDGFLGSYYVPRNLEISGNFIVNNSESTFRNFAYSCRDTVKYDSLKNFANSAFPFTRGEIPAEPFFSSLLEPVVAIGAAAAAVVLFFTVRSK